jgi:hypothetical protein
VFWTAPDDARAFDAYGRLIEELPLHTGGAGTSGAVRIAVALEGIELTVDGGELRALGTGTLTPG